MKAGELCTRKVVTATADESVVEAAIRMTRHDVGTLVVVDQRGGVTRPIGIVTDRDLVTRALTRGEPVTSVVGDVMDTTMVTGSVDDDVDTILARLRQRAVRRMPIVDASGALQGILTLDDIVVWISEELRHAAALIEQQARDGVP